MITGMWGKIHFICLSIYLFFSCTLAIMKLSYSCLALLKYFAEPKVQPCLGKAIRAIFQSKSKITLPMIKQIILHQRLGTFQNKVTFFSSETLSQICMFISHKFVKPDFKLKEHCPLRKNC